jgi:hypothetical protein
VSPSFFQTLSLFHVISPVAVPEAIETVPAASIEVLLPLVTAGSPVPRLRPNPRAGGLMTGVFKR